MAFKLLMEVYKPDNSNWKLQMVSWALREDYHTIHTENNYIAACVADGPVRDLPNNLVSSPANAFRSIHTLPKYYMNVARLRQAVKECTKIFALSHESIDRRIILMNQHMASVNKNLDCDYLENNFYGCTAAGIVLEGNNLTMFNIADSNVMLIMRGGEVILSPLPDSYSSGYEARNGYIAMADEFANVRGAKWEKSAALRALFRKTFVNGYVPGSFGTLNGDINALNFVNIKTLDLTAFPEVDNIVLYTDGNIDILSDSIMLKQILNGYYPNTRNTERTLVAFQKRLTY